MPRSSRVPANDPARSRDDELDALFGALSDRTRRALLERLERGPATISELAAPFTMSLPAVSKHVRVLEVARLVERKVDGRVHHCSLRADRLRHADHWLAHYRAFWEHSLDSLARLVENEK